MYLSKNLGRRRDALISVCVVTEVLHTAAAGHALVWQVTVTLHPASKPFWFSNLKELRQLKYFMIDIAERMLIINENKLILNKWWKLQNISIIVILHTYIKKMAANERIVIYF